MVAPIWTTTQTASRTPRTSVRTTPKTRTASRTPMAVRTRTTTRTACRTRSISVRTTPKTRTASRTTTAVRTRTTKIELKQTVFFDFNKATIKSVSFLLLDDVAQAMKDNPTIKVEIGGHTDSVGDDNFNLKLSQKRAESVQTYLIKKGIASNRMVPKGFGENVPIADNRTDGGRAQNRRVEFLITER